MRVFLRHYAASVAVGTLLGCLLVFIAAGPRFYNYFLSLNAPPPLYVTSQPAAALIGALDAPVHESLTGRTLLLTGWAFDPAGIQAIQIRFPEQAYQARIGIVRHDVRDALPQYKGIEHSGFEARIVLPKHFQTLDRQPIDIVAINHHGETKSIGKRSWLPDFPKDATISSQSPHRIFYLLMMTSGLHLGGGAEIDTQYRDYQSPYLKTGVSVPILYMRTTKGPQGDWAFDPDFDLTRRCDNRLLVEDSLESAIAYAVEKNTPIQFILNGGIWADASCSFSEWDLTDHLEEDPALCQWAQDDTVYPDDHLSHLPGSTASPRLARSLTYQVYAKEARAYKKRNLQAAARRIAVFSKEHPQLFVGVALDADTYMNPFFDQRATFDYNPGVLRQFREWLQGIGPYAEQPADSSSPDLSAHRRARALTLDEINTVTQKHWTTWEEVDPPRPSPELLMSSDAALTAKEVWDNPWWHLWDAFRKHIVHLHYTELAQWATEAGIPEDRIFTAQGFASKGLTFLSVYIEERGPFNRYDSAGVSIEGSKPLGKVHLGAITYSRPARNDVAMQHDHSLFAEFARIDDGWGVVEYNAADIDDVRTPPQYENAYITYRDLYNFDAQEVSHMAWNGSNGLFANDPGYVSYTSFRNTGTEEAMRDFMVSHAFFPKSIRLWTFGSTRHANDDGWQATIGLLQAQRGALELTADNHQIELLSPDDQVLRTPRLKTLTLIVPESQRAAITHLAIFAQKKSGADWHTISDAAPHITPFVDGFIRIDIPLQWPSAWIEESTIAERLRLRINVSPSARKLYFNRIALT